MGILCFTCVNLNCTSGLFFCKIISLSFAKYDPLFKTDKVIFVSFSKLPGIDSCLLERRWL